MEKREPKFIKHWSTFVGTDELEPWREFIDWKPQLLLAETKEERIERMLRAHEERGGVA